MFALKNHNDPKLSEANLHARVYNLKHLLENIQPFLFTEEKIYIDHIEKVAVTDCIHIHHPRRKT